MNDEQMARAFNEWMRLFTEEPETFESEFVSVRRFVDEEARGEEPSYGARSTAFMHKMLDRASTKAAA